MDPEKTWTERMAAELCAADTLTPGEMANVRLKVLLGRLCSMAEAVAKAQDADVIDEDVLKEAREALK